MSVIISPENFQASKKSQQSQAHDLTVNRNFEQTHQNNIHNFNGGLEDNSVCPRCQLPINNRQNRLVLDTCGHTKCRICLLKEESGCFECRAIEEDKNYERYLELRPKVIESRFDQPETQLDERFFESSCRQNDSIFPKYSGQPFAPEAEICPPSVKIRYDLVESQLPEAEPTSTQVQPLALDIHKQPEEAEVRHPSLIVQRDKSPELIFERLPCGSGRGNDKAVSLPFKKSLRFPKVDKQNFLTDTRFSGFGVVQAEVNPVSVVEKETVSPVVSPLPSAVEELLEEESLETAQEVKIEPGKLAEIDCGKIETENKSKKKRGKKAEPLPAHIKVLEGASKSYRCDFCKRSFTSKANVHYHASCGSKEKPFKCIQCGKGFISITHYKIHIRSHSGKRPFVCVYCTKDFTQKGKLRRHMMLHTGERPYCCELCGKGFRDHNALTKHNLVHTEERAFSCNKCSKRFKEISNLKKHMVVHTKEKPYMCETCGKSFGFVNALAHHKLIHTRRRDHVCRLCEKAFRLKRDLGRHMAIHSEKKAFKCPNCEISVKRKDNLERHIRNTHPNAAGNRKAASAAASKNNNNAVAVISSAPSKPSVRNVDSEKSPHLFVVGKDASSNSTSA